MKIKLDKTIVDFAENLCQSLYVVGGYVRNYIAFNFISNDIDLASSIEPDEFLSYVKNAGFTVKAEYKRTGTVKFCANGIDYEYTCFRVDNYFEGGLHTPSQTKFTKDICLDALRRDFKCNAVYYDIKNQTVVDPLGGVEDIKNKVLDTVAEPDKVFGSDGLRLMRLARFSGQLGFTVKEKVLFSATRFADNILDIAKERIFCELQKILIADTCYPFSPENGHYLGLQILANTRVLDRIIPEIALGRGMFQRADFHNYDVLEHTLRCVLYSDVSVRLACLLHDIGKPYCMKTFGKYHLHAVEGERIAREVLVRLKAPAKTVDECVFLVANHMRDVKLEMGEGKIRRFIATYPKYFEKMMFVFQADFSACKDDLSVSPSVRRWEKIYNKMLNDGTPFCYKDLKITVEQIMQVGFNGKEIGKELDRLFYLAVDNPNINNLEKLLEIVKKDYKNLY